MCGACTTVLTAYLLYSGDVQELGTRRDRRRGRIVLRTDCVAERIKSDQSKYYENPRRGGFTLHLTHFLANIEEGAKLNNRAQSFSERYTPNVTPVTRLGTSSNNRSAATDVQ